MSTSTNKLSAEEHTKLDSFMLIIAGEARGHHKHDGSGKHTFGSKGAYCVYADGQYHDFSSSGPTAHGHGALAQIRHLSPDVDSVEWARAFLAAHPGMGDFVPGSDTNTKGSAEEDAERLAYLTALYTGASPRFEDTPGWRFLTETRRLPLPPEGLALLRWIPNFRGDEGVMLVPYTDQAGKLLALGFTYITQDAQKSPHSPARMIYRGPSDWNSRALIRLGAPGPVAVETEGFEKGLAAFLVGYQCVFVAGGVERLGKVPLPPEVQKGILGRDDDPPGSEADQALWRAAMRRRAQNIQVGVTERPRAKIKAGEPVPENLKDLDAVYCHNPDLLRVLLDNADLDPKKHGRLGEAVDNAILDELSWFDDVEFGRAGKDAATILGIGSVERLSSRISKLIQTRIKQAGGGEGGPDGLPGQALTFPPLEPWPDPVDGAELLSAISDALLKYVRMTRSEADAIALCAVHGHCFDCFDIMVIVAITSPHKRSGKTRLARLAGRMAPKPLFISGGSAAFVTRAMELHHLNLFADEFDTVVKGDPEKAEAIRGVFNALFDREGAFIGKCVSTENGHDPRMFSIWGPAWLSGIKKVWDTIEDRAVCIRLKRKVTRDKVDRLRVKDGPEFAEFRRKAARWAADNGQALRDADPPCPNSLADYSDRATDTWGVLFSIAQVADKSGEWLKRAHSASLVLNGLQDETGAETEVVVDKDDETALLVDVRTILLALDAAAPEADALRNDKQIAVKAMDAARGLADAGQKSAKPPGVTPGISGVQLAEALARPHLFPDREWSEWARGKPIKSSHLIKLFREYGIEQKSIRLPGIKTFLWGFTRPALDDAFARYVPPAGGMPLGDQKKSSHSHNAENVEETGENRDPHKPSKTASKITGEPSNSGAKRDVGDVRDADSHTPQKTDAASLTSENTPSEAPKSPQSNIVDLPIGAVPRRRKEVEP